MQPEDRVMLPEERSAYLRRGLVGGEAMALYQTNAIFHHQIEVLIALLPAWVDGLAVLAIKQQGALDRAEVLLRMGPQDLKAYRVDGLAEEEAPSG